MLRKTKRRKISSFWRTFIEVSFSSILEAKMEPKSSPKWSPRAFVRALENMLEKGWKIYRFPLIFGRFWLPKTDGWGRWFLYRFATFVFIFTSYILYERDSGGGSALASGSRSGLKVSSGRLVPVGGGQSAPVSCGRLAGTK